MARANKHQVIEVASRQPFAVYGSLPEYLEHVQRPGVLSDINSSWAGSSAAEIIDICRRGDLAAVPAAEKRADMINDAVNIAGMIPQWEPDIVGAFPNVPALLAGDPCTMWAQHETESARAPLDVCICLGACSEVDNRDITRRGVCILAALLALSRVRTVNTWVFGRPALVHSLIKLSRPFDISELCAVLTRPAFYRQLMVGESMKAAETRRGYKSLIGVPASTWARNTDDTRRAVVELGGVSSDALVIASEMAVTWGDMTDAEFIAKINTMIDQARGGGIVAA